MKDTELIIRCQKGDLNSFSELYQAYKKRAFGTAYLISNQKGIADDIVQEAFIQCYKTIKNLKNPETFDVWFYKVLVRTGWRLVKKHNRFILMEELYETEDLNSTTNISITKLDVYDALEKLSLPLKTVVILHYFNDLTIEEISNVLGCFKGTVKSRLHNARKQLFKALDGDAQQAERSLVYERKEYGFDGNV